MARDYPLTRGRRGARGGRLYPNSREYGSFRVPSLAGGIDRSLRESLTDPGKWVDGEAFVTDKLAAAKSGHFEGFLDLQLSPWRQGYLERGAAWYVNGTTIYWNPNGYDATYFVSEATSGNSNYTWQVKLSEDPDTFWTTISGVSVLNVDYWQITLASAYGRGLGSNVNSPDGVYPRRRLMFRRVSTSRRDPTPANLIHSFPETAPLKRLLVGTPQDVYWVDDGSLEARADDLVNPRYATGTATLAANGIDVTGVGTSWQGTAWPLPALSDWLFKFDAHDDRYWVPVDSVTSNTALSLKYPYRAAVPYGPATYKLIRAWQANVPAQDARLQRWSTVNWLQGSPSRLAILSNGVDVPLKWRSDFAGAPPEIQALSLIDDVTAVALSPAVAWARYVAAFKECLFLLYTQEGGTVFERRIRWSNDLDCELWTATDFRDITGDDEIEGHAELLDSLVVFTTRGIHNVRYVGAPFDFGVQTRVQGVGALAGGSIQAIRNQSIIFLGDDDVYAYDGVRAQKIGAPVRDLIFETLHYKNRNLVRSHFDEITGRYYLSIPLADDDFRNHITLAFDVDRAAWSKPYRSLMSFGRYRVLEEGFVDDDDRIVDSVEDLVDSQFSEDTPVLLAGAWEGSVHKLMAGLSADGGDVDGSITFPLSDLGQPGLKRLAGVVVEGDSDFDCELYVALSANGRDAFWVGPYPLTLSEPVGADGATQRDRIVWINKSAKFFGFRVVHDRADDSVRIDSLEALFRYRGNR